jgi:hypothetical protein
MYLPGGGGMNIYVYILVVNNKKGNTSYQEYDHHEAVEDREPVNSVLEEIGIQILVETVLQNNK